MAPAVTDGTKITASEPAEACEHAAAISAQQGVRGGTMMHGGGGREAFREDVSLGLLGRRVPARRGEASKRGQAPQSKKGLFLSPGEGSNEPLKGQDALGS